MEELAQPERFYVPAIKKMRAWLMFCAILYTYGAYAGLGDINSLAFGFAFPALYITSGFLVLRESPNLEKRLLRAIWRTGLCFLILFAVNVGFSLVVNKASTVAALTSRGFWINFLVFNVCSLPVGSTIWYVQALLYAYIILFVLCKLKLLKLDLLLALLCLAVTVLTGELAGVVGFNWLGRAYLGGNFLTRALPYLLIGRFIGRKEEFFASLDFVHHILMAIGGLVLVIGEYILLNMTGNKVYVGHLLGMGLIALPLCLYNFYVSDAFLSAGPMQLLSRIEYAIPFFCCSPVYALCVLVLTRFEELQYYLGGFVGLLTALFSFAVLYVYFFIRWIILIIRYRNKPAPDNNIII